jgi:zinc protease
MPLIRAVIYFPNGSGDEAKGEEGSTLMITRWMDFGTKKNPDMSSLNQLLQGLGASVESTIYPRFTLVAVEAPTETFIEAWSLALEKIREPQLSEENLKSIRDGLMTSKQARLNTWHVAGKQFANAVVYAGSKDAHSEFGTTNGLMSLSGNRLKEIYSNTFAKGPSAILASQSLTSDQEKVISESTKGWTKVSSISDARPIPQKGRRIIIVDRPASTQAFLFFVKNAPVPGTEEHALTSIGTQILGSNGGNSSVLFDELRAKRGLTYHASMQTAKVPNKQLIIGVTFGANEKLGELTSLYLDVWKNFYNTNDFSIDTLKQADMAYRAMRDRESGDTVADILRTAGETFSFTGKVKPIWILPNITSEKFNQAKKDWLSFEDFTLIALGDPNKIQSELENSVGINKPTQILKADSDWDAIDVAAQK